MTTIIDSREEYRAPLAAPCEAFPDMLCQSDPDNWGNEGLGQGDPWTL